MSDSSSPPRESLIRATFPAVEVRDSSEAGGPVLFGHFARFNEWTQIDSVWEGRFMERIAPGAFKKTFREQRDRMRVLFQHGQDPQIGDKPLGPISDLREDDEGGYYEVPLLDAPYVRDMILPGIKAGLYGASFRFSVPEGRDVWVERPEASADNPDGLPERTIKEARLFEFGPVTFPAYAGATAGVRSITDDFIQRCFERDPDRLRAMFEQATEVRADEPEEQEQDEQDNAPSAADAAMSTSAPERRDRSTRNGRMDLPTHNPGSGINLKPERQPTWPFR